MKSQNHEMEFQSFCVKRKSREEAEAERNPKKGKLIAEKSTAKSQYDDSTWMEVVEVEDVNQTNPMETADNISDESRLLLRQADSVKLNSISQDQEVQNRLQSSDQVAMNPPRQEPKKMPELYYYM